MAIEVSDIVKETIATTLAGQARGNSEGLQMARDVLFQNAAILQKAQADSLIALSTTANQKMLNRDPVESLGYLAGAQIGNKAANLTPPTWAETTNTTQG